LEAEPLPGNFPARNRIVAGISDGCFIVQAARQSGAKITAHFALAQGKELFVLPGLFDDPLSEGCHDLIKEGAEVVTSAQTFCEVFELGADSASMSEQLPEPPAADDARAQVLAACREPRDIDELTVSLSIEFCELQQLLLTLQIEGSIEQNMIGQWSTIR
jgi:DNA processing protein